jgi:AcrR family transcriptional regulator
VRRGNAEDQQALKRELIDAALQLFLDGGAGAVTMRAVASGVGVSAMAPYRYFAGKAELLTGLWEFALEGLYERMRAVVEARHPSARACQAAVIDAFLGYWEAHPDRYRLVYAPLDTDRGATVPGVTGFPVYTRLLALTEAMTAACAAELGVGTTHVKLASDVRFAMQLGYLHGLLVNRRYPWGDPAVLRATYIEQAVAAVERCLRDGPPAAGRS